MSNFLETFQGYAATVLGATSSKQPSVQGPIIHLAIDVQERFSDTLCPDRKESYPKQIHEFRDALRNYGIPTIHIGCGSQQEWMKLDIKHVARCAAWCMEHPEPREESNDIAALGLLVRPYKDEDVVEKYFNDAFERKSKIGPSLRGLLDVYGAQTVIMTGGNTESCVLESARGALQSGFNLLIVYDRLADQWEPELEVNPLWHKELLSQLSSGWRTIGHWIFSSLPSVKLVTAAECLALVALQNNQPVAVTRQVTQSSNLPSFG